MSDLFRTEISSERTYDYKSMNLGDNPRIALDHLFYHKAVGHKVPKRAIQRLIKEIRGF